MRTYLYINADLSMAGRLRDESLRHFTERHKYVVAEPEQLKYPAEVLQQLADPEVTGAVFALSRGWPVRSQMRLARKALKLGRAVYFYWPREEAVERVNRERLQSYWRHWALIKSFGYARSVKSLVGRGYARLRGRTVAVPPPSGETPPPAPPAPPKISPQAEATLGRIREISAKAAPVPLPDPGFGPSPERPLHGVGVYLRTDFWAPISSGGSYGHTCYVARELARVTEGLVCFMPSRYTLLDELGVRQVVLPPPGQDGNEETIVAATGHYSAMLKTACEALRPAYLYERLCLGNYAGAWLSQELGIPYIVEYNGSEISMRWSFDGTGYSYEDIYLEAEKAAFRQATIISVVSERVREDLLKRGVPPEKVFVNPNGADPQEYAPASEADRAALRRELGWEPAHRVIGFTGTFGGWHGIDTLAAALPAVCQRVPEARVLLIGDGSRKHLVDEVIARHNLAGQVHCTGRVSQRKSARLLGACDLFVSPHNAHMTDSRFFGSPTKIFEYMAMAGGIVASDLEQIGLVLSPALRVGDLRPSGTTVRDERSVLCTPGDVNEFAEAVVRLAKLPEVARALGRNARAAVLRHYSWERHVANLWKFLRGEVPADKSGPQAPPVVKKLEKSANPQSAAAANGSANGSAAGPELKRIETGDGYKDEVQNQWNHNPCGSQYVKVAREHTLEWFLEAERYRYDEYAPWMHEVMEFAKHADDEVLEIGGGMGTDLAQFAAHGARVTDLDLSAGHLALAQENFRLRGLTGRFIHHDAEELPFAEGTFDLVYSNGVIHHTPNTAQVVREIHRVLKPGGRAIIMVYAENSLHYWGKLVYGMGLRQSLLERSSMGAIMSKHVELSATGTKPLVKVYTKRRLKALFREFTDLTVVKRQLTRPELPQRLRWFPLGLAGRLGGWNLIIKARKGR
jgi:glycosyltransferase involved in cell wall biosynthesis/ubiquinone/menaquinone biosynthesis C-methylase UbiE